MLPAAVRAPGIDRGGSVPRDEREKILNERSGPEGTNKMFSRPLVVRDGRCEARGQQSTRRGRVRRDSWPARP